MAPLNGPWDPLFCGEFNNVDRDRVCFMCPGLLGMNSNSLSLLNHWKLYIFVLRLGYTAVLLL